MALQNLNNVHLTEEQTAAVYQALTNLENAVKVLFINLSPEDRLKYGSVNEQNKLFINKVYDFANSQPELRSPDVDWEEFTKDFNTRKLCENVLNRLDNTMQNLRNRKILGDYDNLQDGLTDYAFTNYKAGTKAVGYEEKQKEYKQFFAKNKKKTPPKADNTPPSVEIESSE